MKRKVHYAEIIYPKEQGALTCCGVGGRANLYTFTKDKTSVTCKKCRKAIKTKALRDSSKGSIGEV